MTHKCTATASRASEKLEHQIASQEELRPRLDTSKDTAFLEQISVLKRETSECSRACKIPYLDRGLVAV